ncbi:hypothetical protein IFM89_038168 [Coptis chinensis]|uniref:Hyccin n=1 Tax=Coptis chinensis TaxID=261450 RepID=A0A835HT08_9MAGN|nr:hypothetical protein IFM89_038168 [Coptis chinensis]
MSYSNSEVHYAFEALSFILGSIPLSVSSSETLESLLLHHLEITKQISNHLKIPNSGAGENELCRWFYNTFQSSNPTLQLVVLKLLPIIDGVYLSQASLRKSLIGFEAILLAIYAYETTSRRGQAITVNVPNLSHPSIYHEVVVMNSTTEWNLAILSQILEPHGTIRSTKRARIVGVCFELYYSKIALIPLRSKIDFCKLCVIWAGQDGDMYENEKYGRKHNGEDIHEGSKQNASTSEGGVGEITKGKKGEDKKDRKFPLQ